ncbi:MAG: protein kinase [Pyrinomonadaceae bacterium]
MLEAGKLLQGRYRVSKHIGQGGMGSVYLATDERFQSTVAIKEAHVTDENYKKAFEREARLLNSLKHAALPKVMDHFLEDSGQYLVMEYIPGDDLFEKLSRTGRPFPLADVLRWTKQLLGALDYLHKQGIVHRDIKPQNLKLTSDGNIVLLDFGLAKGSATDAPSHTANQSIFGYSRNYASLEQIQGTGTDPRSDIYSLAATVYHLATGQLPADALTRIMMMLNENRDPLEPAGKFGQDISQELSDGLSKCLALKRDERPQNVESMSETLFSKTHTPFSGSVINPDIALDSIATKISPIPTPGTIEAPQADIRTEVMPVATSAPAFEPKTVVMENENAGADGSGWALKAAAIGGLVLLLAVVGFGGGVYYYILNQGSDTKLPETQPVQKPETKAVVEDSNANLVEIEPGTPEDFPTPEATKPPLASTPRAVPETPKVATADKTQQTSTPAPAPTTQPTRVAVSTPTPPPPVRTPPPPLRPPLTKEQLDKLTPKQRRRLKQIMDEQRARQLPPPPR